MIDDTDEKDSTGASSSVSLLFTLVSQMESVCFELSGRGVGEAAALDEQNFVFVVGGVEYRCCRFQACFVSGLVRRLLASDRRISRVSLKVHDDSCYFKDVVSLMNGQKISITPANAGFLEVCGRELENNELLDRIISFQLDSEDISMSNVGDRIRIKSGCHSDYKGELDFLASHFFEVELDVLKCLSISDLELVLTNQLLRLASEDQLYDSILSLAGDKGDDVLVLLRYIKFEFLSESKLDEFLDRIFPDLVMCVWGSLCECVRRSCRSSTKTSLKSERYHVDFKTCTSASGAFNGIIQHIRDECGGNPHEKGVISITASSTAQNQCQQLIEYGWNKWWHSHEAPDSFVQFDFKSRPVCLNAYSLKSDGNDSGHLLSWVLEVSDDGSTWEVIDERNTYDLDGKFVVKMHECNRRSNRFARFVRLRQTGHNSNGHYTLRLSEIEFFGDLKK